MTEPILDRITADAILGEYRKRHKDLFLSWLFENFINSLVSEDECTVPYGEAERIRVADCVCDECKKEREDISLRMWEEYQETTDYANFSSPQPGFDPLLADLSFPDWLKERK